MRERMKKNEQTESQILYQKIFEESADAIAITDELYKIVQANLSFKELTGATSKDIAQLAPKKKVQTQLKSQNSSPAVKSLIRNSSASKGRSKISS